MSSREDVHCLVMRHPTDDVIPGGITIKGHMAAQHILDPVSDPLVVKPTGTLLGAVAYVRFCTLYMACTSACQIVLCVSA
jgi:hypothetical protein